MEGEIVQQCSMHDIRNKPTNVEPENLNRRRMLEGKCVDWTIVLIWLLNKLDVRIRNAAIENNTVGNGRTCEQVNACCGCTKGKFLSLFKINHAVAQIVEALNNKTEGCGLDCL